MKLTKSHFKLWGTDEDEKDYEDEEKHIIECTYETRTEILENQRIAEKFKTELNNFIYMLDVYDDDRIKRGDKPQNIEVSQKLKHLYKEILDEYKK